MTRQEEGAPQYSSFLHLHFIFQILSDMQLLPEHNLSQCSFWETYLTTSDPQHKGWTYISSLFCSRKLLRKSFHFCSFPNFEHKLRSTFFKTQYLSSKDPPGLMVYVPTPLSLVPTQVLAVITSSSVLRERETDRQTDHPVCFQDHREQGFREDDVGLAHLSGATQRDSTGLPLCRVCSQLPRFPKSRYWDTSIIASYMFGRERET